MEDIIEIDTVREWDGTMALPPPMPGYNWAPNEVGLYVPPFSTDLSLDKFKDRVDLVAGAGNATLTSL